jgi:Tol biopolymer transport system component
MLAPFGQGGKTMHPMLTTALFFLAATPLAVLAQAESSPGERPSGTVAFASLAPRGWDLYLVDVETHQTRRLTDHPALDYNAAFAPDGDTIAFVSERDGNLELYTVHCDGSAPQRLTNEFALDDHPAFAPDGRRLAFSSTRQAAEKPGQAWNAIYVMDRDGSSIQRLSPVGVADYSPAWSPKGDQIAVASGSGQEGSTDLYVMKPDGHDRRLVIQNGGWPTFAADGTHLYFHSKRDRHWGIWRVDLDGSNLERITPPDLDVFTPSASLDGKTLVAAVKRGEYRQIERIDLASKSMTPLTEGSTDHWNPSIAPDGRTVVYHQETPDHPTPNVELWGAPPGTDLRLVRLAGAFPAFAPDGRRLALTGDSFGQLDVMNIDGSERKRLYRSHKRSIFSTSWAHQGDRIAFAYGGVFEGPSADVDIATVRPDGSDFRPLTIAAGNDGFPAFSPDARQVVFRSGRDGPKNLYIMDSDGRNVRRLTNGPWTDTMTDWSPKGDWIVFASDRSGDFEVWLIRPDGTDLHKLVAGGGRNNHPHFSRDGQWVVFTSKRAGFSAEEIALPDQPQPYGDLFAVRLDGTHLVRLTHNGFEEGTPAWGPPVEIQVTAEGRRAGKTDY